jgi:hypothetical protein
VPARKRLGLSRQLPVLVLLAMRSDGLRHFCLLRNKPTFCFCKSVSRLSTLLLNFVTVLALARPQKITFAEMREMGVRGLLVYCADYRCSHSVATSGHQWPAAVHQNEPGISSRLTSSKFDRCSDYILPTNLPLAYAPDSSASERV